MSLSIAFQKTNAEIRTSASAIGLTYKVASPTPALLFKKLANGSYRFDEHGELEKCCGHCLEFWPADTEFFFPAPSKGDGLHSWCKACYWEHRNARKAKVHMGAKQ